VSDLDKRADDKRVQEIDWEQFLENRTQQQALPSNRGGFEELPPIEQTSRRTCRWSITSAGSSR